MVRNRLIAALSAAFLLFGLLGLSVGTAQAQTTCPAPESGADTDAYPPSLCVGVVTDSTVRPGQPVTITGRGFPPGARVIFEFHSTVVPLGTAIADQNGVVSKTVEVPEDAEPGRHFISMYAPSSGRYLTVDVVVLGQQGSGGVPAAGDDAGLPRTGTDLVVPLAGGAAVLLLLGAGTVLYARRRREPVESA